MKTESTEQSQEAKKQEVIKDFRLINAAIQIRRKQMHYTPRLIKKFTREARAQIRSIIRACGPMDISEYVDRLESFMRAFEVKNQIEKLDT